MTGHEWNDPFIEGWSVMVYLLGDVIDVTFEEFRFSNGLEV